MSPLLRRYRAERLLREEFEGSRTQVLRAVRGKLRARGASLDEADLEACYATAWHGLYAAMLKGEEIENRIGWLVLTCYRRAIDELRVRSRGSEPVEEEILDLAGAPERDLAAELDDRARLRQMFEALRGRLSPRECEAASLCYLQGLTRTEAAERMGISEARMTKLMEGRGPARPGVARKVGELLEVIRADAWCEEQSSLMRALAFGILDPEGERYRLAQGHRRECPACRSYVLSLRGLAAALPPLALPWKLGAGVVAGAGAGGASAGAGGASASAGTGATTGAGGTGVGVGAGAVGVGAGAGAGGVAGGGWLFAGGPIGAKLAVGCLLAVGVGVGCVELVRHHGHRGARHRPGLSAAATGARASSGGEALTAGALGGGGLPSSGIAGRSTTASLRGGAFSQAERAQREFGLEQPGARAGVVSRPQASASSGTHRARAASAGSTAASTASTGRSAAAREFGGASSGSVSASQASAAGSTGGEGASGPGSAGGGTGGAAAGSAPGAAAREFGPG